MGIEKLIQEKHKISKGFKKHFNTSDIFMDALVSVALGGYSIDIIRFDDWLHKKHGYKEEEHGSCADFVESHFGKEALKFIEDLIKLDGGR